MTIEVNAIVRELNTAYPCREAQFSALSAVVGHSSFPSPPAICLTGFPASGKSTITRAFLEAMETEFAWVDCSETFSSALFFDRIVNKLRALGGRDLSRIKLLADINAFVVEVHKALEGLKGKIILVLEKADYLVQLQPSSLFPVLARLPALSSPTATAQLTVLFLAISIPTRLFGGLPLPTINFPSYTKPQLIKILNHYAPDSLYTDATTAPTAPGDLEPDELIKIWEGLNSAVIDTYGPGTSLDIPTILTLSTKLWPDFVQPIIDAGIFDEDSGEIIFGRVDFVGLFAIGKRKGLFSGEEIVKRQTTLTTTTLKTTVRHELPYYGKFLLISAFLASYNPARDDARIFSRESGLKRKNKRSRQKSNKGIAKMSQRLIGPRAFDLERMIAIFHSITNYEVKQTVDIHMQIATLGTLKLMLRANRGDPLMGGGRWKANVSEEEVRRIAGSVGFSLNDHLVD